MSEDKPWDESDLEDPQPPGFASGDRGRDFTVGLFVLTVIAAFVPVFTRLPLGYFLAVAVWAVGAAGLYVFVYRRVQDRYERERATARRAVAGLAGALLVFQILETGVRILAAGGGPGAAGLRLPIGIVALGVAVIAAYLANPQRLVWFVAIVFVAYFLLVQALRFTGSRPVVTDPIVAFAAYLGLMGLAAAVAFVLVYRDGAARLRDAVS
jgi:hypothetical protein